MKPFLLFPRKPFDKVSNALLDTVCVLSFIKYPQCQRGSHQVRHQTTTSFPDSRENTSHIRSPVRTVTVHTLRIPNVSQSDIASFLTPFQTAKLSSAPSETARNALVILATRNHCTLLESGSGFIQEVLRKIAGDPEQNADFIRSEFDVICACVDGLSPRPLVMPVRSRTGERGIYEGLSFMYGPRQYILPEVEHEEVADSTNTSTLSTITFTDSALAGSFDVTLPLATTLFMNGRLSTLLVSKWSQDSTNTFAEIEPPQLRKNVTIMIPPGAPINPLPKKLQDFHIPLLPLTPARRIVNGMGNIVRTLDFGDGDIGPASRELEVCVTEKLSGRAPAKLDIWAMIVPAEAIKKLDGTPDALITTSAQFGRDGIYKYPKAIQLVSSFVGQWLKHDAKICRVLSGGGGWGAKQGLLSLDPQTSCEGVEEARFDFSEGDFEDQQASALGNLAKEGDYIQFFTRRLGRWDDRRVIQWQDYIRTGQSTGNVVVGAIPSTQDELTTASSKEPNDQPTPKMRFVKHFFGFVSESGMFLCRNNSNGGKWVTKVDVPYSYAFFEDLIRPRERLIGAPQRTPIHHSRHSMQLNDSYQQPRSGSMDKSKEE